jgi:hypothetical protein
VRQSATRAGVNTLLAGWQVQLGHRRLDVTVQLPGVLGLDLVLQPLEFLHELLHLVGRHVLTELHGEVLMLLQQVAHWLHGQLDVLANRQVLGQLGFLRHVTDGLAVGQPGRALVVLVDTGHDAEHRRLAGTVLTDDANLGTL